MILALAILAGLAVAALIVGALTCRLQHERNDCVERSVFRVFAVECGFARYDPSSAPFGPERLARPASGAELGIASSFWIYTRRHAYGRGRVRDWTQPAYLQFMADGLGPTGSEMGYFEVRPRRRYDHDESVRVGVINGGVVRAVGFVTLAGVAETGNVGMRVEATRPFDVRPGGSFDVSFGDGFEGADFTLDKIKFITEPTGEFRVGRLHGRPEWEPVLWRK
jgi:hypothetical protein